MAFKFLSIQQNRLKLLKEVARSAFQNSQWVAYCNYTVLANKQDQHVVDQSFKTIYKIL